jgi:hypothetical protein
MRSMDLRKSPSISETLDWAKALVTLNADSIDDTMLETTLSVLLKHEQDLERAKRVLFSSQTNRRKGDGSGLRPFSN